MKSIQGANSPFPRTTITHIAGSSRFDELKERAETAAAWSVSVAAVVALYAVMLVALYRWSVYAPIFPPDPGAATIEEPIPWPE